MDFEIQIEELLQMWVAEGLIHDQMQYINGGNEETLEDIGEQYLHELVERCMVEVGQKSSVARIKTCRLRDLMRDFCVQTAKLENFLHVININNEPMEEIKVPFGKIRRVAISGGSNPVTDGFILPSKSQNYLHLRSFLIFFVPWVETSMLSKFKYLRVVKFVNITNRRYIGLDSLRGIESLIHLRFLSLRNIGESIQSLENLKCLQTLDLRSVKGILVKVPNIVFRHMEHLRHLYLPRYSIVNGKLQLPNVSKLQTLVNVPACICDFKDPNNGFDEFGKNLMPSNFTFKCLRVLKIVQNMMDKRVDIIPIVMSCPNLYKLWLWGKIEKLPDKISPHLDLAQLTLYLTYLEEDPMPTLEKFPNLKTLHLHQNAYEGKKMVCSKRGFPQLKFLVLSDLYNLEEWEVEEGCMPNLSRLMIHGCKNLIMSFSDGLQFVTTLQKMEIIVMTNPFGDTVGKGEQDSYKIRRVPSL